MVYSVAKKLATGVSLLCMAAAPLLITGNTMAAKPNTPTCSESHTTVQLSPTDPTDYSIAGWLCAQGGLQGKTVQFLEHGATYDHNYWDWPQQSDTYSYVQSATNAGYATFNIDRIGVGQSSHSADPDEITPVNEAYVAHQLVQDLRSGAIGGTPFNKVISVAHSLGSGIALVEASTYQDVDGLVVTGLLHGSTAETGDFISSLYPANLDPQFAGSNLPDGYLTTMPNMRGKFFYNTSFADPSVISYDEQTKQTTTTGELNGFGGVFDPSISLAVHVPVLLIVGQDDVLFCDSATAGLSCDTSSDVQARETGFYSPSACLQSYSLPAAGHDVNLHPDAQAAYAVIQSWALRRVGNGTLPALQPCN